MTKEEAIAEVNKYRATILLEHPYDELTILNYVEDTGDSIRVTFDSPLYQDLEVPYEIGGYYDDVPREEMDWEFSPGLEDF